MWMFEWTVGCLGRVREFRHQLMSQLIAEVSVSMDPNRYEVSEPELLRGLSLP